MNLPETEGELKKRLDSTLIFGIVHQKPLTIEVSEILDEAKADLFSALGSENLDDIADAIKKWFGGLK